MKFVILISILATAVIEANVLKEHDNIVEPKRFERADDGSITTEYPPDTVAPDTGGSGTGGSGAGGTSITSDCKRCGITSLTKDSDGRIVNGIEVTPRSHPWAASLRTKSNNFHFCGGALIKPDIVLTAAHCTFVKAAGDIKVVLGEHDKSGAVSADEKHILVTNIINHENYDSNTVVNDIALLKLAETVLCEARYNTACLPEVGFDWPDSKWTTSYVVTVAGWGTTSSGGSTSDVLLEAQLHMLGYSECNTRYNNELSTGMICAFEQGKDTCQGDSGGPMTYKFNNKMYEIGVVSWGDGCATNPGVYTSVVAYLPWITSKMGAM